MDLTPLRLAYDASVRSIDDQTRVLDELRSRAGTLFAAAAIVTSFLGGETVGRAEAFAPLSAAGLAITCFIASALLTLLILWPSRFGFSLSAREMLREIDAGAVEVAEIYRELAIRNDLNYSLNARHVRPLFWFLRGAILFLVVEVAAWIVALWRL